MSEAYYIAGCEMPPGTPPDELLSRLLKTAGMNPGRVDEIHIYTDAASALFKRIIQTALGPVIQWPYLPAFPESGLFSACRALETSEVNTLALIINTEKESSGVLMANPSAVGLFNLTPRAQLASRLSAPGGIINLTACVEKLLSAIPVDDPQPEEETPDLRIPPPKPARPWLAIQSPVSGSVENWPEDRLISGTSLLPLVAQLISAVQSTKTDPGIWIKTLPDEPAAAMLVLPL